MTRNPRQKALYEVIKSSQKTPRIKGISPGSSVSDNSGSSEPIRTPATQETKVDVSRIQGMGHQPASNFGYKRVLLIPYRVAVVIAIVFILSVFVAFKLGRLTDRKPVTTKAQETNVGGGENVELPGPIVEETARSTETETDTASVPRRMPPVYTGDNVIVIATYRSRNDLEPVQEYFARNGIETEIWLRNNYFYLVTKDRFESTERRGADGYLVKERIKKIGADYEAPSGYESFRPNLFQDVYGMKVE